MINRERDSERERKSDKVMAKCKDDAKEKHKVKWNERNIHIEREGESGGGGLARHR
jgi:hypothetical protein